MIVLIANDLPMKIRGRLKLWFTEPRANVFVSGITDHVADKVISYLLQNCPQESGLIIFKDLSKSPFYRLYTLGIPSKKVVDFNGMQLVLERAGS